MKEKKWHWYWGWPYDSYSNHEVHVSHSYLPLSFIGFLIVLFPEGFGRIMGHVVQGYQSVIH